MLQSWSVVNDDEANINSQLQPALEQTICGYAGNAEIDPAIPFRLCHDRDLALGKVVEVDNGETLVTARGLGVANADVEDGCKQESIRIRLPVFNGAHLAKPHLNALQGLPDVLVSGYRLETTSMLPVLSNLWDESDKPIVCLPAMPAVNQLLYAQGERLGGAITTKNDAAPFLDSALARPESMRGK